jgi:hypothetical protein
MFSTFSIMPVDINTTRFNEPLTTATTPLLFHPLPFNSRARKPFKTNVYTTILKIHSYKKIAF